jgi:hypothetical protein
LVITVEKTVMSRLMGRVKILIILHFSMKKMSNKNKAIMETQKTKEKELETKI